MAETTTRERLLAGALAGLRATGYAGASVDDLARSAGLTKGALYSRFAGKRDLLLALIDLWAAASLERLRPAGRDPFAAVAAFVLEQGRGASWADIVPEFWRQAVDDEIVRAHLARAYDRLEADLAAVIRRWRYPQQAAALARTALHLHDGLVALQALADPRLEAVTRTAVAHYLADVDLRAVVPLVRRRRAATN